MCGRFAQAVPAETMTRLFEARDTRPWSPAPSWNVAPASSASSALMRTVAPASAPTAVVWDPERRRRALVLMRWGFVPLWQKHSTAMRVEPHSARCETVATSKMFAAAFRRHRCLVPVTAWYEWARAAGQAVPHALARADGAPVAIGAVWSRWGREAWERAVTFAVVTTPASDDVRAVHERMPLVLEQHDWPAWLGQDDMTSVDRSADTAAALLRPPPPNTVTAWRVGPAVGNPRNDAPELLAAA